MQPYPFQLDAVRKLRAYPRGGAEMCTGSGKSITMAILINALQMRTLVVVPNLALKSQLKETFISLFGSLNNITVENIDSSCLTKETQYDVLILDEVHHAASKTYQKLNRSAWKDIYHRYFFSGTFFRNQEEEQLLFEGIAGRCTYKLSFKDAVKANAIAPVEAYYYEIPKTKNDFYSWPEVYSNLVVNHEHRNTAIAFIMAKLHAAKKSTLCLVKEIKHGEALVKLTGLNFANGQDEETRPLIDQFKSGKLKTLIGTTGIIGEGVDTKPCEYVIIAGLGKAKSAFMQQIGRGVRKYEGKESAKIIIFKDTSHKFLISHFKAQCAILKEEYGVTPIKLEL